MTLKAEPELGTITESATGTQDMREIFALTIGAKLVLIDLHIGRKRMIRKWRLKEMGVLANDPQVQAIMDKYIEGGPMRLFPPEVLGELDRIERVTRDAPGFGWYKTTWGKAIHIDKLEEWEAFFKKQEAEYLDLRDTICDPEAYDYIVDEVRTNYAKMVVEIVLNRYPSMDPDTKQFKDLTSKLLEGIMSLIPSAATIHDSFRMSYEERPIPFFITDEEIIDRAMDNVKRKEEIEAWKRIKERQAEKAVSGVDKLLSDVAEQLERTVLKTVQKVLTSADSSGSLTQGNMRELGNMIQKYKSSINELYSVPELDKKLDDLLAQLGIDARRRDDSTVVGMLESIQQTVEQTAEKLVTKGSRFDFIKHR